MTYYTKVNEHVRRCSVVVNTQDCIYRYKVDVKGPSSMMLIYDDANIFYATKTSKDLEAVMNSELLLLT